MGPWEEQLPFLFSLSWDPEAFYDGSPLSSGGVLIPPTAPQMRDVNPNQ
ncbi:MAG: hypothetical protein QW357_13830 [Saccharolobus sp.]